MNRKKFEGNMDDELRFHLDAYIDDLVRSGVDPAEAARRARIEFGAMDAKKDECREASGYAFLDEVRADLRLALRTLRRNPGFAAVAILSLALGIGANTAIFGVVDAVLLRPLPYPEPGRLVRLWESKPAKGVSRNVVNGWNFIDWRDHSHSFENLAAVSRFPMDLTGDGDPVSLPGMQVTPEFFPAVGVQPERGRWLQTADDEVLIGHGLWQTRYGSDPNILGRRIVVVGSQSTIVGVMPEGFRYLGRDIQLFTVLPLRRTEEWRRGRQFTTVGRLKPGVSLESAIADMQQVARASALERPDIDKGWSVEVVPLLTDLTEDVQLPLLVLMGAVGFLLLVACANVANLLLMRGAERTREIAVRAALGASRARIARQLITESLLLGSLACAAGLALGYAGLSTLPLLIPAGFLPRMDTIHLDLRVTAFTIAVSLLTTVLFGLFPAFRISRVQLQDALKQGTRGSSSGQRRFRVAFVVAQVAMALILVSGAALMARSFARLMSVDPGFRIERVLTLSIGLPLSTKPEQRADSFARILESIGSVAGVESVSSATFLPLEGRVAGSCYGHAGEAPPTGAGSPGADMLSVGPAYLKTMGIPLIAGREFTTADRIGKPSVVMVTRSFAQKAFGTENALGRRLNVCWTIQNPVEIIGVTADIRQRGPEMQPKEMVFLPNSQAPAYGASLLIRTSGDAAAMTPGVIAAIHRVNSLQAVSGVRTLDEIFARSVAEPRFRSVLLSIFAGIALLLAAIGVYGVVAYSVTQRTREIGIRMALGATRGRVARLILRESAWLAALGVAIGLAGATALGGVIGSLLYEVPPTDPLTLGAASLAMAATVAFAALVPARRATRIAPVIALREE